MMIMFERQNNNIFKFAMEWFTATMKMIIMINVNTITTANKGNINDYDSDNHYSNDDNN